MKYNDIALVVIIIILNKFTLSFLLFIYLCFSFPLFRLLFFFFFFFFFFFIFFFFFFFLFFFFFFFFFFLYFFIITLFP
jgi:hypothetical protein